MVFIWRNLKGNKQLKWNASHHMYERSEVLKSNLNRIKIFWSFFLSKASSGHYVIRKSEQGKLCGLRFFTFFFQFFLSFFQFKLCHFPFFSSKSSYQVGTQPAVQLQRVRVEGRRWGKKDSHQFPITYQSIPTMIMICLPNYCVTHLIIYLQSLLVMPGCRLEVS